MSSGLQMERQSRRHRRQGNIGAKKTFDIFALGTNIFFFTRGQLLVEGLVPSMRSTYSGISYRSPGLRTIHYIRPARHKVIHSAGKDSMLVRHVNELNPLFRRCVYVVFTF